MGRLPARLRALEEVLIATLADFGITAGRWPGLTGVWVANDKIAAIGVKVRRWIISHGFALNVNVDLDRCRLIVACGIQGGLWYTGARRYQHAAAAGAAAVLDAGGRCARLPLR